MAYARLQKGQTEYPIVELTITETAMRGYEWEAQIIGEANSIAGFNPNETVTITLYDDAGQSMTFPPLISLQASSDPCGIISVSGLDRTTYKLTKEVSPDNVGAVNSIYNSSRLTTMQSIVNEIATKCGVTLNYSAGTISMYGLGTLSGTGVSLLDRVLGLFNAEWRVANDGRLLVQPLLWQSAANPFALPTLSAQRRRDYEQRKTSLGFSKILSLPSGQDITVKNGSNTQKVYMPLLNQNATGGFPANRWIDPYTKAICELRCPQVTTAYNEAMDLGGNFQQIELMSVNDRKNEWHVRLYHGDPGPEDEGNYTLIGEVYGAGSSSKCTANPSHPITHARIYRHISYQSSSTTSEAIDDFPHHDGIKAVLRCWEEPPETAGTSFSYLYETNKTPANPDTNVVSDVLWSSKSQCISLAPGQMWADNRQSHTINYSGPWILGLHVRDSIEHSVFPDARIDQVTYSLSCGSCSVSLQCAVLGGAQW